MFHENAECHFSKGLRFHQLEELAEAKNAYQQCLALNPNHLFALINLGSICRRLGETSASAYYLRRATKIAPNNHNAHFNLANALRDAGDHDAAVASYQFAVSLNSNDAAAWYNLGVMLGERHDINGQRAAYRQAIVANPHYYEARLNLACSYSASGEITLSRMELQALIDLNKDFAPALNNMAALLQDIGEHDTAWETLVRTIELAPELPQPRSNVLMSLQYHPGLQDERLYSHALEWGKWALARASMLVKNSTQSRLPNTDGKEREQRLRVGYVSADLCAHPVGLFVQQVLASHNSSMVQPVVYSNGNAFDEISHHIKKSVCQSTGEWAWRDVRALDDMALAEQIRADAIDVLVDLSGHTAKTRLSVFALQPAPVQISWMGYFATTGLPTMDFVILDPYHAPAGTEEQFCERIIRLPHNRFCYQPAPFAPEVSPPPFLKKGFITFGSFNNTAKLNESVLSAWAAILQSVPKSRLILKWRTFADGPYCEYIHAFFADRGIPAERLELRPMSTHRKLLEEYADIDIALDPFPFSGGHTSCETLWMGVPVITLPQGRVVSRQTWSFLNNIGLPGLAAADVHAYVQLAVNLANSTDTLLELRQSLRDKMRASPLCDVVGFTRFLEEAYFEAWSIKHSASSPSSVAPTPVKPEKNVAPDFMKALHEKNGQLRTSLERNPEQPNLWIELAEQMASLLQHEAVVACANEALRRRPDDAAALTLKGNALRSSGKVDEALACYRRVLELLPGSAVAHCNFGVALQTLGRYDEAIVAFETAISRYADIPLFWGNLAVSLTYSSNHGPHDVRSALRRFDKKVMSTLRDDRAHNNDRNPERRLRVGYVSPDFRKHAVAYFALPLIEGHNPENVEVFCYYNHRQDDEWTARFRQAADHWVPCADLSDSALAERIRADRIDILVDLAGHTENNCLPTFARKPAPVQVTWMGYVTTTGLSAMDWRVTHVDADPPGVDVDYSEKLWRLRGTMWCYRPLPGMPEVSPPPVQQKGYVTFGSFNRFSKTSSTVLKAWANILRLVPNSRLVICVPEGQIRDQMARFFAERGVIPERISAFAKLSHEDFWKLHSEVDIALDPFPFGGGTTTCETLWMGVPLVTVTGSQSSIISDPNSFPARFASRMGYAFLNNLGLPELVAETVPQYIDIAVQLASDIPRLAQLRQSLRPRMAAAPLTDEARFVREIEEAYRAMWRHWCVQ